MSVSSTISEGRRLVILRVVSEEGNGALNENVLRQAVGILGLPSDYDTIRGELDFLARSGCVRLEPLHGPTGSTIQIVHLTDVGERVALGEQFVHGVARRTNLR